MAALNFTIICDTREKTPWDFDGVAAVSSSPLATGDYSIVGLKDYVAIERKSLSDLVGCVTFDRDRFKAELKRLGAYRCRSVIIEGTVSEVYAHSYRSKVTPESVIGSVMSWQTKYQVPFVWAGEFAPQVAVAILRNFWDHCRRFAEIMKV